ncbi:MAG: endonuclease/exonuclease/phosphatase family protein [Armatimonadetes bacterium]|nr:endonuclease/exonuclease/phosphatase family protein [Armatimonadota bacterium]
MRVACLNIHAGRCGTGANRASLPEIADLLRSVSPDVCLLQEVDRRMPRSGFADMSAILARAMQRDGENEWFFAFGAALSLGGFAQYGNVVLSRQPFAAVQRLALPASGGEPRGAVGVTFGGDKPVAVWTTHLGLRSEWRESQLLALADAVNADARNGFAVIVGGDFNAGWDAPETQMFASTTGLFPATPDAPTFPALAPAHRIDFLLAAPGTTVIDTGLISDANASDHALIWADFSAP